MHELFPELAHLIHLARVSGWPMRVGPGAAAVELPGGAVVAIVRRRSPPHTLLATVDLPAVNSADAFDLASALAGLAAGRVVWGLLKAVDAAPHLVEPADGAR